MKKKIGVVDTRVPGEPGWPEGEGWGRNAKSWLPPQTPDPGLSSGRPVGSQPQCSPEPAAWQHRGHREGEGDPVGEANGTNSPGIPSFSTYWALLLPTDAPSQHRDIDRKPRRRSHIPYPSTRTSTPHPTPGWSTLALAIFCSPQNPSIQPHSPLSEVSLHVQVQLPSPSHFKGETRSLTCLQGNPVSRPPVRTHDPQNPLIGLRSSAPGISCPLPGVRHSRAPA